MWYIVPRLTKTLCLVYTIWSGSKLKFPWGWMHPWQFDLTNLYDISDWSYQHVATVNKWKDKRHWMWCVLFDNVCWCCAHPPHLYHHPTGGKAWAPPGTRDTGGQTHRAGKKSYLVLCSMKYIYWGISLLSLRALRQRKTFNCRDEQINTKILSFDEQVEL